MRRNAVAVVGAAETTELGVIPNMSQIQLHADAALNAIADAGLTDQILVLAAADGQKEALELIATGEYGATGLNDPALVARTAVDYVVEYLNGRTDFPTVSYTPPVAITQENVAEFYNPEAVF